MKKLLLFSLLSISWIQAQTTKNLGDFEKVTAFDKISVQLIPSEENKIELSGNLSEQTEVINANGELKIRMPLGKLLKGEDIIAKVYFKKIEALEANEGSYISSDSPIEALNFNVLAKEGSQIKVGLNTKRLVVKSSQGSVIKLTGETTNLEVVINSGGELDAEKLTTEQATISVNAGGTADIRATQFVDAKVRAGGTITIFGNPKQVNKKVILGGDVILSKR